MTKEMNKIFFLKVWLLKINKCNWKKKKKKIH